jgi:hypothetical protein
MPKFLPSVLLVFLLGSLFAQDFGSVTTVCRAGAYELQSLLTTAGAHEIILTTTSGCDSIVSTFFQLLTVTDDFFVVDLCLGDPFRGRAIVADTTMSEIFTAASGSDSNLTFTVTIGFATRPSITGPGRICTGEETRLEVNDAFSSYAWCTGGDGPDHADA